MLKRFLCRVLGHKHDWDAEYYGYYDCMRCREDICNAEFDYGLLPSVAYRIRRMRERLAAWLKRCPDCGRRFGRHDPGVDHIPF